MRVWKNTVVVGIIVCLSWFAAVAGPMHAEAVSLVRTGRQVTVKPLTASQGTSIILPYGRVLQNEELQEVDGEFLWFLVGAILVGGAMAIYHNWFDGSYGIDHGDLVNIAHGALVGGVGGATFGGCAAVAAAASAYWNSH